MHQRVKALEDPEAQPRVAKLTHENLSGAAVVPVAKGPKRCIGNMERTILEGFVDMNADEIRAKEIETGERQPKRCIGNMERTMLEGFVPMSEEDMRKRDEGRG